MKQRYENCFTSVLMFEHHSRSCKKETLYQYLVSILVPVIDGFSNRLDLEAEKKECVGSME